MHTSTVIVESPRKKQACKRATGHRSSGGRALIAARPYVCVQVSSPCIPWNEAAHYFLVENSCTLSLNYPRASGDYSSPMVSTRGGPPSPRTEDSYRCCRQFWLSLGMCVGGCHCGERLETHLHIFKRTGQSATVKNDLTQNVHSAKVEKAGSKPRTHEVFSTMLLLPLSATWGHC